MDKTRASLRRVRVYAVLLVVCGVYAVLPPTQREAARLRAHDITEAALDWAAHRFGGR
jgi:hypothetical protein